jgi:hypothetical protein
MPEAAPAPVKVKPFTWSYSKLKNFETCPKRHFHIDVERTVKEADSEQLKWGNAVHSAAAKHLGSGVSLPTGFDVLRPYCERLVTTPGNILVEQKLALNRDFGATTYFAPDVWFRAVGDVIKIQGSVALTLDWKTGKIVEDSVQLALTAACIFAQYPEVQKIRSAFIWLKESAETEEDFVRADMPNLWRALWPRIEALERAYTLTEYPAKPGFLCRKWCPIKRCPHNGV